MIGNKKGRWEKGKRQKGINIGNMDWGGFIRMIGSLRFCHRGTNYVDVRGDDARMLSCPSVGACGNGGKFEVRRRKFEAVRRTCYFDSRIIVGILMIINFTVRRT